MSQVVRIRLFGTFAIRVGDEVVPEGAWRLRKARSLVKLLALAPERRLHRERVMDLLWPDRPPDAAANNLHQALYVARRALEAAGAETSAALPLRDDMLALFPDATVEVDVAAFETAAAHARETGTIAAHQAALELHGGELLPEDRYETWAIDRGEALAESHRALLVELAARLDEDGDVGAAIEALEQVIVIDPLHEEAHRDLMRLFAAAGRRQRALSQYHLLREALERELAAEPDPQTARLYRELLRGDDGEDAPRDNLPIALTSFVGRERELREVGRLLDRNRMVTLTGAGGAGKTRLALEAAAARAGASPDGVRLVELASLSDPDLVATATASALDLTLPAQRPALDGLAALLGPRRLLLVIDNCEHLVAACAVMAGQLLEACPGLRILATSREPLRVPGEVTWRVPSLALADTAGPATTEELGRYESIRLFCERAADVSPGFALSDENAGAVAEVCARLDGMPLALELAAARVAALSPAQIAERLEDSLAVLTAGRRSALDRQQTLRATLRWSYDLLTDPERALFRRLAVFAGYFALEAAESVAAGDGVDERGVADVLARLVDKSLVVADEHAGGYRYRLLEPMRQYARERLAEFGEAGTVGRRHLGFYLALARNADPDSGASSPSVALDELEADHDNLRAALAWALGHDGEQALALAVHMWPMWMAGSHFEEGRRWLRAALAASPAPTALRADALRAACGLEIRLGHTPGLAALGAERVAIYRALGDRHAVAHALDEVGVYEYMVTAYDRADERYAESRALGEELGDPKVAAAVRHSLAVLAQSRSDFPAAREGLLESLALLRELPADEDAFFRVHTVGLYLAGEGPARVPRMYFEETMQFFRRVEARGAIGYVLAALGDVERAQGRDAPARAWLSESLAHFRETGDPMGVAFASSRLGVHAGALGEHDLGRERLDETLALRRELGDRRGVGMTLGNLGVLAARAGDLERGRSTIGEALALFEETDDAPGQMGMRLNLGNVAAGAGATDLARGLLEQSRRMATAQRLLRTADWTTLTLAELAVTDGDPERARSLASEGLERMRSLGDRWGVARATELLQAAAKTALSPSRDR